MGQPAKTAIGIRHGHSTIHRQELIAIPVIQANIHRLILHTAAVLEQAVEAATPIRRGQPLLLIILSRRFRPTIRGQHHARSVIPDRITAIRAGAGIVMETSIRKATPMPSV